MQRLFWQGHCQDGCGYRFIMRRHLTALTLAALAALSVASCDKAPTAPTTLEPTEAYLSVVMADKLTLAVGDSTQLRPLGLLKDGSSQTISSAGTWSSSDSGIAAVNETGIVRAVAAGAADITLTVGSLSAKANVTVAATARPTTYTGSAAASGSEAGTLTLSFGGAPFVSGTLALPRATVSLLGRFDSPTKVLNVTGGGYTLLGILSGTTLSGSFVDADGGTGGFTTIESTHTAVTPYCGTYTSDGKTPLGNADSGAFGLSVALDGSAVGASVPADVSSAPLTFAGRRNGNIVSLTSSVSAFSVTVAGEKVTGTFQTSTGAKATIAASQGACR